MTRSEAYKEVQAIRNDIYALQEERKYADSKDELKAINEEIADLMIFLEIAKRSL